MAVVDVVGGVLLLLLQSRLCIPFSIPFSGPPPNRRNPARNFFLFLQKGTSNGILRNFWRSVHPYFTSPSKS